MIIRSKFQLLLCVILVAEAVLSLDWSDFRDNIYLVSEGDHFGFCVNGTIDANYAYLVNCYGLEIWDISDPTSPNKVTSFKIPGYAKYVVVRDGIAYVADGGLWTIDVRDPTEPVFLGHIEVNGGTFQFVLEGDLAYLADDGLSIVSVSDPENLSFIGRGDRDVRHCKSVAVKDDYAFISGGDGLYTYSLEDIEHPEHVRSLYTGWKNQQIVVQGDYLYACLDDSFCVFDCSDPSDLETVEVLRLQRNFITISGARAFLSHSYNWLNIYDISDPTDMQSIAVIYSNEDRYYRPEIRGMAVKDDILIACEREYGFEIFDISNVEEEEADSIGGGDPYPEHVARGLDKEDDYLYVLAGRNALEIYSVLDPFNPTLIGSCGEPLPDEGKPLCVYNGYAYADWGRGIFIFDVRDVEHPRFVKNYNIEGARQSDDLTIRNDILFINTIHYENLYGGILLLDIRVPEDPDHISTALSARWMGSVDADDRYIYGLDMESFKIFDYSNPEEPELVGEVDDPGYGYSMDWNSCAVYGDYAYIAIKEHLVTVNIEDKTEPYYTNHQELETRIKEMSINEKRLFLAMHRRGFRCYSLEEPDHPRRIGFYDTPGYAYYVVADGDLAYVADYFNFSIYSIGDSLINDVSQDDPPTLPNEYSLSAYPNPFNSTTSISYSLPMPDRVTVKIFDLSGRKIATLVEGRLEAGHYNVYWNGLNTPSGVYVCRMEAGSFTKSIKLALVR